MSKMSDLEIELRERNPALQLVHDLAEQLAEHGDAASARVLEDALSTIYVEAIGESVASHSLPAPAASYTVRAARGFERSDEDARIENYRDLIRTIIYG